MADIGFGIGRGDAEVAAFLDDGDELPALGGMRIVVEIKRDAIHGAVAAVSVGIYRGVPVLDLDYAEDSDCDTDMNVVMNDGGGFIELQGTAEGHAFRRDELDALLALAERGCGELFAAQRAALQS